MNAAYEKKVGQRLRALRKQRGLSQGDVVARLELKKCYVTRSALAKIEVGQRHLYVDELKALREALGVRYEDLLD